MTDNPNSGTNFPQKLLLRDREVSKICKAFGNKSSANIRLSTAQLSKMLQLSGFLGRFLDPSLKTSLSLI